MDHTRRTRKIQLNDFEVEEADYILSRLATKKDLKFHRVLMATDPVDPQPIPDFHQDQDLGYPEHQPKPDKTSLEVEIIQVREEAKAKWETERQRSAIHTDAVTAIPFRDMIHRVNAMKSVVSNDYLRNRQVQSRAPGKSLWNSEIASRMLPLDFIASVGRSCGNRLREQTLEQKHNVLGRKIRQPPVPQDLFLASDSPPKRKKKFVGQKILNKN